MKLVQISRRNLLAGGGAAAAAPKPRMAPKSGPEGRTYRGEHLREIAFPLGGIGTGTVSLGGYGQFRDWEIFNRPNKGHDLPFTFVALRMAGSGLKRPIVRVVERQPLPPYPGGFGLPREHALGLPRFKTAAFTGAYPFATVAFGDPRVPVAVTLEAFNPMIPLATDDSGLPVAILRYHVESKAASRLDCALAFSLMNPVGYDGHSAFRDRNGAHFGKNLNEFRDWQGTRGLFLSSERYPKDSPRYGSLALVTDAKNVSFRLAWEHGEWWDDFQKWWDEFASKGRFTSPPAKPSEDGKTEYATLAAHFPLDPGAHTVTFVLGWHFPNTENYWSREKNADTKPLKNHYGTRWPSAWDPAVYALANLEALRKRSSQYRTALYNSTLPEPVLDAVSSQASILRTNTLMVMENKVALAFEGCGDTEGCCPMNCTHVYNYEQTLAHLYPDLERSMRETDFLVNMRPDGSMSFRTPVPLRQGGNDFRPAADGQMGCIMKVYREWRLSGDRDWLEYKLWPSVQRALDYAWTQWDADRDGVMEGEQHNTYDIEFYGPNPMMSILYLGALAAAAKMARLLGETVTAQKYEALLKQGSTSVDLDLWEGEFYVQRVAEKPPKARKYQHGAGCLSDQLLGQWFAEVVDLGHLVDREHVRTALASVFKHNFRTAFDDFPNTQRIYALNDEAGLLLCSWPHGGRPAIPFPYSDEVWTGIEYQVAAHLIYEGMLKEGLAIVKAARDRYNGLRRNPWDEVECGHHYARAMSSWSLLLALSGFAYSAPEKSLRFQPRVSQRNFRCLFSAGTSWGEYSQQPGSATIAVHGGTLEIATLRLPVGKFDFPSPRIIRAGEKLTLP